MSQESVTTYCPTCAKPFKVAPELQGKRIVCKTCQTHFTVQADNPGIPVSHPQPAAAPPVTSHAPKPASAAPPAVKPAPAPHTQPHVAAATSAPAPAAPSPPGELAPIPFDDSPLGPQALTPDKPAPATVVRPQALEKVKIESKGPYFVVKLVTAGKMVHVSIENALNEHAADGWKLEQVVTVNNEAYAILSRASPTDARAGSH